MQELYDMLMGDLKAIGIKADFNLVIKPYSKTLYGRYNPNNHTVILYVYRDSQCTKLFPYKNLLFTAIHECVHHIQWSDEDFVRLKGVMHNAEFYQLFEQYTNMAKALLLLREVVSNADIFERDVASNI